MGTLRMTFGALSVLLAVSTFIPYLRGMLRGILKPHAFSWFLWFAIAAIGFAAQVTEGAGPGAWLLGYGTFANGVIFLYSLAHGDRGSTMIDRVFLVIALASLVLWRITSDPTGSVILIAAVHACAYGPTFRKSYREPWAESASLFGIATVQAVFSLLALETVSVATALILVVSLVMNGAFTAMLLERRRVVVRAAVR